MRQGKLMFSTATIDKNQTASMTGDLAFEQRRAPKSLRVVFEGYSRVRMYRLATVSDNAVSWVLWCNCSVTPRQLAGLFGVRCAVSLTMAGFFWMHVVMAFSALEWLAPGSGARVEARARSCMSAVWLFPEWAVLVSLF